MQGSSRGVGPRRSEESARRCDGHLHQQRRAVDGRPRCTVRARRVRGAPRAAARCAFPHPSCVRALSLTVRARRVRGAPRAAARCAFPHPSCVLSLSLSHCASEARSWSTTCCCPVRLPSSVMRACSLSHCASEARSWSTTCCARCLPSSVMRACFLMRAFSCISSSAYELEVASRVTLAHSGLNPDPFVRADACLAT
jgi:hypothetical protein